MTKFPAFSTTEFKCIKYCLFDLYGHVQHQNFILLFKNDLFSIFKTLFYGKPNTGVRWATATSGYQENLSWIRNGITMNWFWFLFLSNISKKLDHFKNQKEITIFVKQSSFLGTFSLTKLVDETEKRVDNLRPWAEVRQRQVLEDHPRALRREERLRRQLRREEDVSDDAGSPDTSRRRTIRKRRKDWGSCVRDVTKFQDSESCSMRSLWDQILMIILTDSFKIFFQ